MQDYFQIIVKLVFLFPLLEKVLIRNIHYFSPFSPIKSTSAHTLKTFSKDGFSNFKT